MKLKERMTIMTFFSVSFISLDGFELEETAAFNIISLNTRPF
jgi:hypothetical protein